MKTCSVAGCSGKTVARNLCNAHYKLFRRKGTIERVNRKNGTGTIHPVTGRIYIGVNGKIKFQHVHIAETALGHSLPKGAQVHHVDENCQNNTPSNLVICQDQSYHWLLHKRTNAINACGHADWRKCRFCLQHDSPENLYIHGDTVYHLQCRRDNYRKNKTTKSP